MKDNRKEVLKSICRDWGISLSVEDINILLSHSSIEHYKHKTIITAKGGSDTCYYYIHEGLVRRYFVIEEAESTTDIVHEGLAFTSRCSKHSNSKQDAVIESIEPTTLLCITGKDITRMAEACQNLTPFITSLISRSTKAADRFSYIIRLPKVQDRYLRLMEEYPEIVRRTPVKCLASFLMMRPETLSRIRRLCPDDAVWSAFLKREGKALKDRG